MVNPFSGDAEMGSTVPADIRKALTRCGHRLVAPPKPIGGSQVICIDWKEGVLTSGSDPRKGGATMGY
ncbi:MAG: hypothetical protein ACR2RF_28985 [Geminicoccaceae bacterium]